MEPQDNGIFFRHRAIILSYNTAGGREVVYDIQCNIIISEIKGLIAIMTNDKLVFMGVPRTSVKGFM